MFLFSSSSFYTVLDEMKTMWKLGLLSAKKKQSTILWKLLKILISRIIITTMSAILFGYLGKIACNFKQELTVYLILGDFVAIQKMWISIRFSYELSRSVFKGFTFFFFLTLLELDKKKKSKES